jgi:hypothetical protein
MGTKKENVLGKYGEIGKIWGTAVKQFALEP